MIKRKERSKIDRSTSVRYSWEINLRIKWRGRIGLKRERERERERKRGEKERIIAKSVQLSSIK